MNPDVSAILAELEDGGKDAIYLSEKLHVPNGQIMERLSYVVEHGFVIMTIDKTRTTFTVDKNKLNEIMAADENFSGVVDGLTELDQFLN
ncbi:MAG: hypothetical protein ACREQ5_35245, partial [Candidatus Dormibacteria bacterium]